MSAPNDGFTLPPNYILPLIATIQFVIFSFFFLVSCCVEGLDLGLRAELLAGAWRGRRRSAKEGPLDKGVD